jgi:hypothetical protein
MRFAIFSDLIFAQFCQLFDLSFLLNILFVLQLFSYVVVLLLLLLMVVLHRLCGEILLLIPHSLDAVDSGLFLSLLLKLLQVVGAANNLRFCCGLVEDHL